MEKLAARIGAAQDEVSQALCLAFVSIVCIAGMSSLSPLGIGAVAVAIAVLVADLIRPIVARARQGMLGALETSLLGAGLASVAPVVGLSSAVVLAAMQGIHHPNRVLGGVVGYGLVLSCQLRAASDLPALALGVVAYLAVALACMALHRKASASIRHFRAFGHEFRTPLTNILQNAQMGTQASPTAAQKGYLDNIALAARHMDMLLSNVLDFLKLMTGNYVANSSDVDLVLLSDSLSRLVEPLRRAQQVDLHPMSYGPLVQLRTSADALRIAAVNLLSNAIKFNQEGRVAIVTRSYRDGEGYRLCVRVVDEGSGVPEALRGRLFTEFTTGEPWNRVQRGTGLGLALVRELVERIGGRVFYRPREKRGSEFGFDIPVQAAQSAELKQVAPGNYFLLSTDDGLREALAKHAKSVECFSSLESLKDVLVAQPDVGAIVVVDARALVVPIDRAGVELGRVSGCPLFAVLEPVDDLGAIELDIALSGFRSMFDARNSPAELAESIACVASPVISTCYGAEASSELRASFAGRVLVVEDDPMQLRYIALTLGQSGIVTIGAGSIAEARNILSTALDCRLLIIDYNLPDGTAPDLIREIRHAERTSGEGRRLPIAVITAEDRQVAIADLKGTDYDWFQSKPITEPLRLVRLAVQRLEGQDSGRAARPQAAATSAGAALSAILAPDFAVAAREAMASILAEARAKRWDDVYRHAHKLKGLAALMNERGLVDLCASLDRRAPEPADPASWLSAIESEANAAIARAHRHFTKASTA